MKKLLFCLLLVCSVAPAFAQFHLGISAGSNYTFWKWYIKSLDTNIDYKPASGWRLALLGEWQFSPKMALRAEADAQGKTNKLSHLQFPDGSNAGSYYESYQFLGGSLLLQIKPLNKTPHLFLLAGISDEWLDKAWSKLKGATVEGQNGNKNPIDVANGNYNRNVVLSDIGFGGDIPLDSRSKLKVEGRFQYMLNNLSSIAHVDASAHSVILSVAYLHKL